MILWVAAPVLFLIAVLSAGLYLRQRGTAPDPTTKGLSAEDRSVCRKFSKSNCISALSLCCAIAMIAQTKPEGRWITRHCV
jgi:hypothetical protein